MIGLHTCNQGVLTGEPPQLLSQHVGRINTTKTPCRRIQAQPRVAAQQSRWRPGTSKEPCVVGDQAREALDRTLSE